MISRVERERFSGQHCTIVVFHGDTIGSDEIKDHALLILSHVPFADNSTDSMDIDLQRFIAFKTKCIIFVGSVPEGREADLNKIERLLSKKPLTMIIGHIKKDQLESMKMLEVQPERQKEMLLILEQDHVKSLRCVRVVPATVT